MQVTKEIEWDMGHRVLNHKSKCHNLHGHRYKAEICLEGNLVSEEDASSNGMVIDFGDIKSIAITNVHDILDHAFMVWDKDELLVKFYQDNPNLKHFIVSFTPTAENLSLWIFQQLDRKYIDVFNTKLKLKSIRLWETPSSSAVCNRDDLEKNKQ
jgi:6-pyruvoyltetrahydropterin/6-carboxytetrahydropterin synthase